MNPLRKIKEGENCIMAGSLLFFVLFFLGFQQIFALSVDSTFLPQKQKNIVFGSGINHSSLRDYGTSPLLYSGNMPMLQLGYEQRSAKAIFQFNLNAWYGNYQRKVFENPFKMQVMGMELRANYLHRLSKFPSGSKQWYVGAAFIHQLGIRNAEHFQNSGFSVDNISHLGPQVLWQKFLQQKPREKKIGKFVFRRPERNFLLQAGIRLPVISSFHRPGYVFIANGTKEEYKVFDQYQFSYLSFRGLFLSTSITRLMRNGNGFRVSYDWSVVSTGNKLPNRFEMANHFVQASLLFKINAH